jgi:hypothetical protein
MKKTKEYKSKVFERILKEVSKMPLERRLKFHLEMADIEHWNNGEYNGDVSEQLNYLLDIIEEWSKNKTPLRNN